MRHEEYIKMIMDVIPYGNYRDTETVISRKDILHLVEMINERRDLDND